jgi:ankyrin repeat protein
VEHGALVSACDSAGWTALHHAASRSHSHVVEYLVTSGVRPSDIDARDGQCRTPLVVAAAEGQLEAVRYGW